MEWDGVTGKGAGYWHCGNRETGNGVGHYGKDLGFHSQCSN